MGKEQRVQSEKNYVLNCGSANTSPELNEWEVTKHEMARGAGGESVMSSNKRKHQNGEQSKGQIKHVVVIDLQPRKKERDD